MSILGFFKSKKKVMRCKEKIPVEEQLRVLSELGIKPKHGGYLDWVCTEEWGREALEDDPYNLILFSLGGERETGGIWERLSDDVYSFDMECVVDDDIYADILIKLAALSKGAFNIENAASKVDHENQKVAASFVYNGISYSWDLLYDDDWFDRGIINKIDQLIKDNDSSMFFYTCSPDQNLIVLFTSQSIIEKINGLVTVPFVLGA